jgi:protocatechuate 3,4-dioxygenase beta subunit
LRDFPADERNLRVIDLGDVAIDAMAMVSGTVVDAKGTFLAGRSVTLVGSNADRSAHDQRASADKSAAPPPIDRLIAQRVGRTDDQGRFSFADVAPGDYRVRAFLDGVDDPVEIEAHVAAAARVAGLKLVLDEGSSIEGRVFGPDGNPVEKASVTTHFTVRDRYVHLDSETDAQGRFRLVGLTPRSCDLSVLCWDERQNTRFAPAVIKAVQAGTHDVVIRLRNVARIEGSVIEDDGTPVPFATIIASLNIRGVTPVAERGQADGSFFIDVAEGDVVDLSASISAPASNGAQPKSRQTAHVPGVASGTKGVVLRFPPR